MKPCLYPGCKNNGRRVRGLCLVDYYLAIKLIKEKKTTWERLEKNGKALPKSRQRENWFLK